MINCENKRKILIIGGGNSFDSEHEYYDYLFQKELRFQDNRIDWKKNLLGELSDIFDLFYLSMPSSDNAVYDHWKITLDKTINIFDENSIFIGHSLGGIFLVKYLSI
jgi:predicted alpha/beta hydrolase family esterase